MFLDRERLHESQSGKIDKQLATGFVKALSTSKVVLPLVSHAALKSMRVLDPAKGRDKCDNLLVEWMLSLELLKAGRLKAIHPIVIGSARG